MEDLITIIVPVYNVEKYIKKCIDSILHQTYKNLEIILVDDESPDNCGTICDEYTQKDYRVRVIHKKNGGLSDARNIGLKIANGKYIGFIDSDDYIKRNMIQDLYNLLKEKNADISICAYELLNEDEKPKANKSGKIYSFDSIEAIRELLMSKLITSHCWNKLYKKELWENIEFPIGRKFEDIAVMHLIFEKAKRIVYKDEIGYYYIKRNNSIMKNVNESLVNDLRAMSIARENYIKKNVIQNNKYAEISEVKRIKMCYDYIILGKLEKLYNSTEYIKDYKKLKKYMRKYKFKAINTQISFRKKVELCVLYLNRNLYKLIVSILGRNR